jgi:two-component sensor histidine kinase
VELECAVSPLRLTIDQAVPLGLIVSELATNAAKYAFPGARTGRLVVRLDAVGERATLSVADDGIGLPEMPDTSGTGIGLGMVSGLARQVGGTLTVERSTGTVYMLSFTPDRPVA